jgi:DNA-binding response OmpR family regulator
LKKRNVIKGKRVLIVDDEKDVLDTLVALLDECKVDAAESFEEAEAMLKANGYDIAILDIMGVRGFQLVEIAKQHNVPALMLTAHALSKENLKRSAEAGAEFYAPKDKIQEIAVYVADVLEAREKNKSPWRKMFERLGGYYDRRFGGTDWREKEQEFWREKFKQYEGL